MRKRCVLTPEQKFSLIVERRAGRSLMHMKLSAVDGEVSPVEELEPLFNQRFDVWQISNGQNVPKN